MLAERTRLFEVHRYSIRLIDELWSFLRHFDYKSMESMGKVYSDLSRQDTTLYIEILFKNKKQFNLTLKISPDYPNLIVGQWNLYDKSNHTRCRIKNRIGNGHFVAKSNSYANDIENIKELIKAPLPSIEKKVKNNE